MKAKSKKILFMLLLIGFGGIGYVTWLQLRPIVIVAVHEDRHFSDILVKNFPLTDKGKINWWLENKDMLKEKYGIPKPESDGSFTIVFWLFGDGYKETDGYDRLCFDDMKTKTNCIDKNRAFSVSNSKNMGISFIAHNGIYRMRGSGDIIKDKDD
ncbi:putative membrane protein [Tatumella ptyseos ATCC 33301]|uniref:Putative membrane protein n=2 Tax=Tatumella ptyseos TaxID=82987 RepID=A0A085JQ09_9GAMM|nr:DUF943 family protein [Tatumella ptyseos]KFD22555.1 putative membrane protein [Tatumella ptyseos ATCC 33301]SQK72163.1 Enterobacterial putative membrane protein (DUF943) [Tatumella ptyseos]